MKGSGFHRIASHSFDRVTIFSDILVLYRLSLRNQRSKFFASAPNTIAKRIFDVFYFVHPSFFCGIWSEVQQRLFCVANRLKFDISIWTSLRICIWSKADICIFPTRYCLNLSYGTRSGGSWFHWRSHQAPASGPTGAQSPYCQWVQETQVSTTKAQTQVTG